MAAMGGRVFGTPITDGTRTQRALAAKNNPNAGGKLDQVLQFTNLQLQKVAAAAGGGQTAHLMTTYGRLYNATGETITYLTKCDWEGRVVDKYPLKIENGQWAVFEHDGIRQADHYGSVAAVVYHIKECCDFMLSWNNPWKKPIGTKTNTVYCEMDYPGYYDSCNCDWDAIHERLMASGTESKTNFEGHSIKVTIEEGKYTSLFSAYFNLDY